VSPRRGVVFGGIVSLAGALGARRLYGAAIGAERTAPSASARTYVLEQEQTVDAPLADVFAFFSQPANLPRITPPSMGFRIIAIENQPTQAGTALECRIRLGPLPQRWRAVIVEYEPPHRFVDVQTHGPYRWWRHEHTFAERDGRTVMRDRVEYQLPLGPVGVALRPIVSRNLRALFDYRRAACEELWPTSRTSA
jgi:ligand-binding SRPBCC domain-containing protein